MSSSLGHHNREIAVTASRGSIDVEAKRTEHTKQAEKSYQNFPSRCCLSTLFLVIVALAIPLGIYATRFGEATSCRFTYTDDPSVSENEMQYWMSNEQNWPLTVPSYDSERRTCVCSGFEDKDPTSLRSSDEVLVWIAPGDLVSLSNDGKVSPRLDPEFVHNHKDHYDEKQHVKVCLRNDLLLDLWKSDEVSVGGHCHAQEGNNVGKIYLGWDGALFCSQSPPPSSPPVTRFTTQSGTCGITGDVTSRQVSLPPNDWCLIAARPARSNELGLIVTPEGRYVPCGELASLPCIDGDVSEYSVIKDKNNGYIYARWTWCDYEEATGANICECGGKCFGSYGTNEDEGVELRS